MRIGEKIGAFFKWIWRGIALSGKAIKRRFGKGFTFLLVPNSCASVKSLVIPFPIVILILAMIICNVLVFVGFTTQVGQIYRFRRDIFYKDMEIAQMKKEQKEVKPALEKSNQMAEELTRLKAERAKILSTWKAVQQKGGRVASSTSRGVSIRTSSYSLQELRSDENGVATTLMKLNNNLGQLEKFVDQETDEQRSLWKELLAYEDKLDHTPSKWPVPSHRITSGYGNRYHPVRGGYAWHSGVDIKASYGTKVVSTADGRVTFSGYRGGYGYAIIVDHGYGYRTLYAHNSKLLVGVGAKVTKGMLISYSGNSGTSTGPHLHYEVHVGGKTTNPVAFLRN